MAGVPHVETGAGTRPDKTIKYGATRIRWYSEGDLRNNYLAEWAGVTRRRRRPDTKCMKKAT